MSYTYQTHMPAPLDSDVPFEIEIEIEVTPAEEDSYSPDYGGTPGVPEEHSIVKITNLDENREVPFEEVRADLWDKLIEESIRYFNKNKGD